MTPAEQYILLRETSEEISRIVDDAYNRLTALIRTGVEPLTAVQTVTDALRISYGEVIAAGLGVVIGELMGTSSALALAIGQIQLSQRLYAQAEATAAVVQSVVQNHVRGFMDARALALELYEGYGFNPTEPLVISRTADLIPKYLKELLIDPFVTNDLAKAYAKAQIKALRTGALRAAYIELLTAIDNVEAGSGADFLDKKLRVAFYEKTRYFADRIARTELQRAFAQRQAREMMLDTDLEFVQWRLSPTHPVEDICDYFAHVNNFGLGPGVYPKESAPVGPAHPFCQCVLSPRLDLTGKIAKFDGDAESRYFNSLPPNIQRLVAGSAAKLVRIKAGETAWDVHNSKIPAIYQVVSVIEVDVIALRTGT